MNLKMQMCERRKLILSAALATVGGAIGFVGAYFVGRAMQTTLYGIPALDARAFAAVFVLLLMSAWIACLIPAWRASQRSPARGSHRARLPRARRRRPAVARAA